MIALLDVDGTLVDTNYHHAVAWYRAFRRLDKTIALVTLHRRMGMGGDHLVADVAGEDWDAEHGEQVREYEKEEYSKLIGEVAALEHATEFVRALQERDVTVILASSAKEEEVKQYMDLLGLEDLTYTTSSDVEATKPAPDLVLAAMEKAGGEGEAVMLGDSTYDCESAKKAGVRTVGLLTGGFSEEELLEAGAVAVHRSLSELLDDLDAFLGEADQASA